MLGHMCAKKIWILQDEPSCVVPPIMCTYRSVCMIDTVLCTGSSIAARESLSQLAVFLCWLPPHPFGDNSVCDSRAIYKQDRRRGAATVLRKGCDAHTRVIDPLD